MVKVKSLIFILMVYALSFCNPVLANSEQILQMNRGFFLVGRKISVLTFQGNDRYINSGTPLEFWEFYDVLVEVEQRFFEFTEECLDEKIDYTTFKYCEWVIDRTNNQLNILNQQIKLPII